MNSTWYMYFVAIKQWTVTQHTVSHTRHVTYITITQTGFNHIHTDSSDTQGYFPHTHTFNGFFSGTQVSLYQKGKTSLDFTKARDSEWQWQQLGHTQVCTYLQTDNHASTPPLVFYRPDALPAAQPTASKHWRPWLFSRLIWNCPSSSLRDVHGRSH